MVYTRNSYSKDVDGAKPEEKSEEEEEEEQDVEEEEIVDDEKEKYEKEEVADEKPPVKRKRVVSDEMYDKYAYPTRSLRSFRPQTRSRDIIKSTRSSRMCHVPSLQFSSSLVRRSDRRSKKMFESFNESEILRTIDRKNQEVLEAASMYDAIKRRRLGSDDEDESEEEEEEEEEEQPTQYSLRKQKPKTKIYQAPPMHGYGRRQQHIMFNGIQSPINNDYKHVRRVAQHSSSPHHQRRRASSTSSSDDEAAFERRKEKSMAKGRSRCLPMNFKPNDLTGVLKNRERARESMPAGSSLADVDPMTIDTTTSFEEIGGLDKHIRSLKEMVVFPLLYPEVFKKFSIAPPRGVLFHGPPGTGKTLVARALANECSHEGKKVAFFMRKGADCLTKWVGESERQLRLLFDQAYTMRPSIIFFDEIDGIAPVRSTRQDQIHSSIVSTLLALMDGLDARGEIVIIGATNRLDSIDPALRRPGRFDREFLFGLPNKNAREKIFTIHTSKWQPKVSQDFISELADKSVGYCGADIKSLCTEAALFALRRRYPQIYKTNKKLVLNTDEIKISAIDFKNALKRITPASARATLSNAHVIPEEVRHLLENTVQKVLPILRKVFPYAILSQDSESEISDNEESASIFEGQHGERKTFLNNKSVKRSISHRPRFLLYGHKGNGQTNYVSPYLLYTMEHLTTHTLDLPALFGNSSRTPEEAISLVFREARRTSPSIVYIPHINTWFASTTTSCHATLTTLLQDTPTSTPLLLLATATSNWFDLPPEVQDLFHKQNQTFEVKFPTKEERYEYFKDVFLVQSLKKPSLTIRKEDREQEVLEEASSEPVERTLTANEAKLLQEREESTLRELRIYLRQVTWKLLADRKFKEFSKPVDLEEVDDYLQVVEQPMDLSTMMTRINSHHYDSCAHYLKDIELIVNNCLEYNPDRDQFDKVLRNRACELKDIANALIYEDLDPEFEKQCFEISQSRKERGHTNTVPAFMVVKPKNTLANGHVITVPDPTGTRYSHRVRGIPEPSIDIEQVNKQRKKKKSEEDEVQMVKRNLHFEDNTDDDDDDDVNLEENVRLLLSRVTSCTNCWTVDRLEQVYVQFTQLLKTYARTRNRSTVVNNLTSFVDQMQQTS